MGPLKGGVERGVSDACALPELEFLAPVRLVAGAGRDPDLHADAGGIAARLFSIGAQLSEVRLRGAAGGTGVHHPSVAPFLDAPERQVMMPPEPDRDATPDRRRIDAGVIDVMPLPLELHMRLGPQGLHDLHLFLGPPSPIVEVLVETHELHFVPADPTP